MAPQVNTYGAGHNSDSSDSSTSSIPAELPSHHRHPLPSVPALATPASPHRAIIPPPPPLPREPDLWEWRCHKCKRRHPLAATRRCFYCGHKICLAPRPVWEDVFKTKKTECRVNFDYSGWKQWGNWRRGLIAHKEIQNQPSYTRPPTSHPSTFDITSDSSKLSRATYKTYLAERENAFRRFRKQRTRLVEQMNDQRLARMRNGLQNCEMDCDWPSECRHEKARAFAETSEEMDSETEYWEEDDENDGEYRDDGMDDVPETSQWDQDLPPADEAYPEHYLTSAGIHQQIPESGEEYQRPYEFTSNNDESSFATRDHEDHIPVDPALSRWPATHATRSRTPLPDSPRSPEPSDEEDEDEDKPHHNAENERGRVDDGEEEAALIRMHRDFMAGRLV